MRSWTARHRTLLVLAAAALAAVLGVARPAVVE